MRFLIPGLLILTFGCGSAYFYQQAKASAKEAAKLRSQLVVLRTSLETATADLELAVTGMDAASEKLRTVAGDRTKALAALSRTQKNWNDARQRVSFLEKDLRAEISQRRNIDEVFEQTSKALREERDRHNREIWEAKKFMPEGVRQALVTANELLREDGQTGLRFLKAMKIENKVLHKVQILDRDVTSLAGTIYIADQLSFDLDRISGTLTLCFRGGYCRGPHGREEFPLSGKRVVLPDADGRSWEARLPFLVEGYGEYPVAENKVRLTRMGQERRVGWLKRINTLLEKAGGETRYRVDTFRNLEKAQFRESLLLGYDKSKKLSMSAEADRLWLQVDGKAKTVEIWVEEGMLRKRGGDTPIPSAGYRIRLPGVTPEQALDAMLGMVKRK
jgi:hypothetical protein